MDEAGTPFCVTVDFETLDDESVTIRHRDDCSQTRVPLSDLCAYLGKEIDGF